MLPTMKPFFDPTSTHHQRPFLHDSGAPHVRFYGVMLTYRLTASLDSNNNSENKKL